MTDTPALVGLFDLFAPWRRDASCLGMGPDRFFPTKAAGTDTTQAEGKAICAQCPVLLDCLEDSMIHRDEAGLWGGAGEPERRVLVRAWLKRPHGPGVVSGCSCAWCVDVAAHLDRLDGLRVKVRDTNGRKATHGRRSTFARGCRCTPCRWSASAPGQVVARCGESTPEWWAMWAPDGADDAERWEAADMAAAELLVDVMVGWSILAGMERAGAVAACRSWVERRRAMAEQRAAA